MIKINQRQQRIRKNHPHNDLFHFVVPRYSPLSSFIFIVLLILKFNSIVYTFSSKSNLIKLTKFISHYYMINNHNNEQKQIVKI